MKTCVLCKKEFSEYGNNPEPLAKYSEGQCCDECDDLKVIPQRLRNMGYSEKLAEGIGKQIHASRGYWLKRGK